MGAGRERMVGQTTPTAGSIPCGRRRSRRSPRRARSRKFITNGPSRARVYRSALRCARSHQVARRRSRRRRSRGRRASAGGFQQCPTAASTRRRLCSSEASTELGKRCDFSQRVDPMGRLSHGLNFCCRMVARSSQTAMAGASRRALSASRCAEGVGRQRRQRRAGSCGYRSVASGRGTRRTTQRRRVRVPGRRQAAGLDHPRRESSSRHDRRCDRLSDDQAGLARRRPGATHEHPGSPRWPHARRRSRRLGVGQRLRDLLVG